MHDYTGRKILSAGRAWYGGKKPAPREMLEEAVSTETTSERLYALEPEAQYGNLTGIIQSIRKKMATQSIFTDWTPEKGFIQFFSAVLHHTSSLRDRLHILGQTGRFKSDPEDDRGELKEKIQELFPERQEFTSEMVEDLARKLGEVWQPLPNSLLDLIIHQPVNAGRLLADRLDPDESNILYITGHSFAGVDEAVLQTLVQTRTVAFEQVPEVHLIAAVRNFLEHWDGDQDAHETDDRVTLFETLLLHELVEVVLEEMVHLKPLPAHLIASTFEHCLRDDELHLAVEAFFLEWHQPIEGSGQDSSEQRRDHADPLLRQDEGEGIEKRNRQRHYVFETLDTSKPSVLVIDDSSMIRHLVGKVAERMGAQIVEAEDGVEGLTLARHYQPDVIVLDVHMEEKSGLQTLKEIRTDPRLGATPVIMLTVDANRRVIREALDWKVNDYLIKPVAPKKLRERLNRYLEQSWKQQMKN